MYEISDLTHINHNRETGNLFESFKQSLSK